MNAPAYPLRIYYDASCPLCAEELHALKDADRDDRLHLIDCSAPGFSDAETAAAGIAPAELMDRIHAIDASGRWHRGVDVFALAYDAVGLRPIARLWASPRLRPLWDRLYPFIARHRQALSRLRLGRGYGWLLRRAACRRQGR